MKLSMAGPEARPTSVSCTFSYQLHKHSRQTHPVCRAAAAKASPYKAPSSSTAATELDSLRRFSNVVPDTVLMQELSQPGRPAPSDLEAATVSSYVLTGILKNPAGLDEHKRAIERALLYDVCAAIEDPAERAGCELDKALVNIGSLLLEQVAGDGRVSTEVDPRLAYNSGQITSRVMNLIQQYQDMGADTSRIIFRIPATWEGIAAAKELEGRGVATHLILINSFVQAVAAAQAGVSVIQPNIGRIGDWFNRNPGAIKNPKGPREDSGSSSDENPAIKLVERIYNYCQQKHPKTKVMAAGIRSKEDAVALAGVDYLVVGPRVIASLANAATMQGYNDGWRSGASGEEGGIVPALSPEAAKYVDFHPDETLQITKQLFQEGLGSAGLELLDSGITTLSAGVHQLEEAFRSRAFDRL